MDRDRLIYLDNGASTFMPLEVKKAMIEWCNKGNPSSGHNLARESRRMMTDFRAYIAKLCKITVGEDCAVTDSKYEIVFTSGASESNCSLLHSVVTAYAKATGTIPHVIMSAIEHKSLLEMAHTYEREGIITATFISPTPSSHVLPRDIAAAVQPNTCLVCVMHANNETGAVNNIRAIGEVAHKHNIAFHCDTAQTFGKIAINPVEANIDSFCISFHKIHGPPGVGALVIKHKLLAGYKLAPYIFGTQNAGMRGGTENLPGIGASFTALKITTTNRLQKNNHLSQLRKYIITDISSRIPSRTYAAYTEKTNARGGRSLPEMEIVFISGLGEDGCLPNTILLSVVKRSSPPICNSQLRKDLEAKGIIISIGSACNTSSPKASHVLYAIGADDLIRRGALRVTLGDDNTIDDAKCFVREFITLIAQSKK
jgi:cysteine desulfurase